SNTQSTTAPRPGDRSRRPSVGIVGAGMAGLTAALRLAERNFDVTVYERNAYIGGLLSAHTHGDGTYHEHSYHMVRAWYQTFWQRLAYIGLRRESAFAPREIVRYVGRREPSGEARSPRPLYHPGMPERLIDDMFSGIVPPADMFLAAYSLID